MLVSAVSVPPGGEEASKDDNPSAFQLRVESTSDDEPLIVRVALANNCTTGTNVHFCNRDRSPRDQSSFMKVLRDHASIYPTSPTVKYSFTDPEGGLKPENPDSKSAFLYFDWAAKSWSNSYKELITFALPHHVDILHTNEMIGHCVHSLHGNACLVKGSLWTMEEELEVSLRLVLLDLLAASLSQPWPRLCQMIYTIIYQKTIWSEPVILTFQARSWLS